MKKTLFAIASLCFIANVLQAQFQRNRAVEQRTECEVRRGIGYKDEIIG